MKANVNNDIRVKLNIMQYSLLRKIDNAGHSL